MFRGSLNETAIQVGLSKTIRLKGRTQVIHRIGAYLFDVLHTFDEMIANLLRVVFTVVLNVPVDNEQKRQGLNKLSCNW